MVGKESYDHADPLWRIYYAGGDHPQEWDTFRAFGPAVGGGRFDHHPEPQAVHTDRSIYYAGASIATCVAEVFQPRRTVDTSTGAPHLVRFTPKRSLHLMDIRHLWPTRAGASQAIASGPRPRSQRWSRSIYSSYPVDGVVYRSSMHGGDTAIALYERGEDALPAEPDLQLSLHDSSLTVVLSRIADTIGYGFR